MIWLKIHFYFVISIFIDWITFFGSFSKQGKDAKKSNSRYVCSLSSLLASGAKSYLEITANSQSYSHQIVPALL